MFELHQQGELFNIYKTSNGITGYITEVGHNEYSHVVYTFGIKYRSLKTSPNVEALEELLGEAIDEEKERIGRLMEEVKKVVDVYKKR